MKEVQEPIGEGLTKMQRREKTRKTGANTKKEEKIWNTRTQINHHAFNVAAASSLPFPGLFFSSPRSMHFSVLSLHCSSELIHLNNIRQPTWVLNCTPPFFLCPTGSLVWENDPARLTFFFEKQNKEKVIYDFFWYVYFKVWIFFIVKILVLCLEYPVFLFLFFWRNVINILIYQICFLVCCIRPIP